MSDLWLVRAAGQGFAAFQKRGGLERAAPRLHRAALGAVLWPVGLIDVVADIPPTCGVCTIQFPGAPGNGLMWNVPAPSSEHLEQLTASGAPDAHILQQVSQ